MIFVFVLYSFIIAFFIGELVSEFVHLSVHSHFSFGRGVASPVELVAAAHAQGARALALTDRNGLYGLIWFLLAAREAGIQPLIGAELDAADADRNGSATRLLPGRCPSVPRTSRVRRRRVAETGDRRRTGRRHPHHHGLGGGGSAIRRACYVPRATLLARHRRGYTNLCRLLTARHADPQFDLTAALRAHRDGLVVLTDDHQLLAALAADGSDDLYANLIPGPGRRPLLAWARQQGIPPVASNDVYFLSGCQAAAGLGNAANAHSGESTRSGEGNVASAHSRDGDHSGTTSDDWALHRLIRAIHLNSTLSRLPAGAFARRDATLLAAAEMAARFLDCPEALANTVVIAERCRWTLPLGEPIFPPFPPPQRPESWQEAQAAAIEGEMENSAALLERICLAGACRRYGAATPAELPDEVTARLAKEMSIVRAKGYADYFLVVRDIVCRWPRTCGRGSAAASLIAYCLQITHVDPVAHDLFFERFLNEERRDPPDIDVDFPWDEREQVQQYVLDAWGRERTAMVANHVCFRARAAVREVAKVWGLPDGEIAKVSRRLARAWLTTDVDSHVHEHPLFAGLELDEPWPEILRSAARLEGIPRGVSTHCGGVVMVPDELARTVPTQPAPAGVPIIHWDKDQTEAAGLVKIDLLGNRSLAVIRDALAAMEENHGHRIDYTAWDPLEDPATQALLARGDTLGVFYVESPSMRLLQQKTRRGDFTHLVIHSSIIRPAANDYINEYVRRLHGGAYTTLHPILDDLLEESYGIMCYQEDVSRTAIEMAGFSAAEADELRKILSKKHQQKRLDDLRRQFFDGAAGRGIRPGIVEAVWRMIESFAGYSFCKPHSASYALVSFKSAWLRAHYPAEFLAAVIANGGGYYDTFAYISEARRLGIAVLPPCVNASAEATTGFTHPEVVASIGTLRLGLLHLKGLTEQGRQTLLAERERNGPFADLTELLRRVPLAVADGRILVKAGTCDAIAGGASRPELMWQLAHWYGGWGKRRATEAQPLPLAGARRHQLPAAPPYDRRTVLAHELETLGFLLSCHPLELYREALARISQRFASRGRGKGRG
ncbi:MAG: DNA polymerase III subunit alpha, partial [Acidobacteriota bacterium]